MIRRLVINLLFGVLAAGSAWAQSSPARTPANAALASPAGPGSQASPPRAQQAIEQGQATLKQVEQDLAASNLTDSDLESLRDRLDPVIDSAQQAAADLNQRLAAIKARLAQLGPAPAAGAPPEAPSLASTRAQQLDVQKTIESELAQANLEIVDAEQLAARISTRRRDLFVNNVFARTYSVFSPTLWSEALSEAPEDARAVAASFSHWSAAAAARLDGWTWFVFLGALGAIGFFYALILALARRILSRANARAEPSRLAKTLAAVWVMVLVALPPIIAVGAIVIALRAFELVDASGDPLARALVLAVARVGLVLAVARGLLAPGRPNWRLPAAPTHACQGLLRLSVLIASLISLGAILNAMADQIGFSLPLSAAIRALTALAVAGVMAVSLHALTAEDAADDASRRSAAVAGWLSLLRLASWILILALIISVCAGYIAFSAFLLEQLVFVSLVGVALYVFVTLVNEGFAAAFAPNGRLERVFASTLGVRRNTIQQFTIIVSGAATIALWIIAALLVLAPWGVGSTDLLASARAAYFGFHLAGVTISLSSLVVAAVFFAAGLLATRGLQRWFDSRLLPATRLDPGLRNSIGASIGYAGAIAAAAIALARLGVDFQKIAIVAGALSVGIGFGLQSIVNNFVSGLILLWERAIRVGDLVVVGDEQGHVRRINVRSTEIETFDRVTLIVPNSNLVTNVVKNWVRGNRVCRIKISLTLAATGDPEQIRDLLVSCARDNPSILKMPPPQALLTSIDGGSLKFDLVCFVDDVETASRVKSDLHYELFRRLKEVGLEPPPAAPAPVTVQIPGLERLIAKPQNDDQQKNT